MTHSLWLDLLRDWWSEETQPDPGEAIEYAQHRQAVMPVIVAAIVAVLMVVALMWLPGVP